MFPVAADAFASPDLIQWKGAPYSQMVKRDELEVLSGDATMKVTLGLAGQLQRRDGGGPTKLGSSGGHLQRPIPWCTPCAPLSEALSVCNRSQVRAQRTSPVRSVKWCNRKMDIDCAGWSWTMHRSPLRR